MACPKVNPNYPNTATLLEVPFLVTVRRVDPGFDREKRFDKAYQFDKRVFIEDALLHGAYLVPPPAAVMPNGTSLPSIPFDTVAPQDGTGKYMPQIAAVEQVDAAFRAANGFCDGFTDPGGDFSSDFNQDFGS